MCHPAGTSDGSPEKVQRGQYHMIMYYAMFSLLHKLTVAFALNTLCESAYYAKYVFIC